LCGLHFWLAHFANEHRDQSGNKAKDRAENWSHDDHRTGTLAPRCIRELLCFVQMIGHVGIMQRGMDQTNSNTIEHAYQKGMKKIFPFLHAACNDPRIEYK